MNDSQDTGRPDKAEKVSGVVQPMRAMGRMTSLLGRGALILVDKATSWSTEFVATMASFALPNTLPDIVFAFWPNVKRATLTTGVVTSLNQFLLPGGETYTKKVRGTFN